MKKNTESIGKEKMTDQELSDAFGRYQLLIFFFYFSSD